MLAGCGGPTKDAADADSGARIASSGPATFPGDAPSERISARSGHTIEYRDAVQLGHATTHEFSVDSAGAGSVLRIGLLDAPDSPVQFEVSGEDGQLASFLSHGDGTWQDWRIPMTGIGRVHAERTISFHSKAEFWISTLECVNPKQTPPSVIVILLDTLRQDHLGSYGYSRPVSRHLDAFARDAVRFTGLVPSSSWTRPSVASLLTSTYPGVHGAVDRGERIRPGLTWIADAFEAAGYETEGIMTNPNCVPMWGFGNEFDRFVDMGTEQWHTLDDKEAMLRASRSIRNAAGRPQFLYVHALAPHEPFTPPEPFKSQFATTADLPEGEARDRKEAVDLYDAEIAYFDSLFREFVADLKSAGVYDSSVIVFVSDHGEEFWDHGGFGHGKTLYEEQLRVPLLMKLPNNRRAGTVEDAMLEMVDIAPTLLDLAELPPQASFQGTSFAPLFSGGPWTKSLGYASLRLDDKSMESSKTASLKFIQDLAAGSEAWYDLATDPKELEAFDAPPAEAGAVKTYARTVGAMGAAGLHIMITHDASAALGVTGTVVSAGAGSAEATLRYPEELSDLETTADGVRFALTMPEAADPRRPSAQWLKSVEASELFREIIEQLDQSIASEQDYAELVVPLSLGDEVRITLTFDQAGLAEENVFLGRDGTHATLDGAPLNINDLIAAPFAYDPAALPRRSAVYIWYVAPAESISDESLDPALRESLRALGYTGN